MVTLDNITDPTFEKKPSYNAVENFFLKFIKDERDLPFVWECLRITFIQIPFAVFLFTDVLSGWQWGVAAVLYLVVMIFFAGPYTLMLHNTSHRPFFKREYGFMNAYIPWVLGPFMGQSPDTYFSHHIGMHHAENNLEDDKSSTMKYQRDSFFGFLHYFGVFFFIGIIELINYFKKRDRSDFVKKVVRGEFSFVVLTILMCLINWKAAIIVFVIPFILIRFSMMAGNWGQHAFIDASNPGNSYVNSITCINSLYNRRCFNDGYHIGHHLSPHKHWTDMPVDFLKNKDKYVENKAIVFQGMDFQEVWLWLMLKRYDVLASRFVNINNAYQSDEEIIAFLKERTRRISTPERINVVVG